MVAELWEESVVLLREEMCWETRDVLHVRHNVRDEQYRRGETAVGANDDANAVDAVAAAAAVALVVARPTFVLVEYIV